MVNKLPDTVSICTLSLTHRPSSSLFHWKVNSGFPTPTGSIRFSTLFLGRSVSPLVHVSGSKDPLSSLRSRRFQVTRYLLTLPSSSVRKVPRHHVKPKIRVYLLFGHFPLLLLRERWHLSPDSPFLFSSPHYTQREYFTVTFTSLQLPKFKMSLTHTVCFPLPFPFLCTEFVGSIPSRSIAIQR